MNPKDITNDIHRQQKLYFIRQARHHLFGTDFEVRDAMSDDDAISRFDGVWRDEIRKAIVGGDEVSYEETLSLLAEGARGFCRRGQLQIRFRLSGTVFVGQLEKRENGYSHNQLWAVAAKNFDTRNLVVTFQTQEERDAWTQLALRLKFKPEELGLRALMGFMKAITDAPSDK